jgi:hypothetical protein
MLTATKSNIIFTLMLRFGSIITFCGILLILPACGGKTPDKPVYEQVKIYDLAPSTSSGPLQKQLRGFIELDTYIFELPDVNYPLLQEMWNTKLSDSPLRYRSAKAFKNSGFTAGVGTIQMWNEISAILRLAECRKSKTVSLLLPENQSDYIPIARIENERTVFYAETDGRVVGLSLSNGQAAFQVKTQSIPTIRGAFRLVLQPVFRKPMISKLKQLAGKKNYEEITFDSVGLEMQMSPGQFVLLGPREYERDRMSLSRLFFKKTEASSLVQIYLILCRNINE